MIQQAISTVVAGDDLSAEEAAQAGIMSFRAQRGILGNGHASPATGKRYLPCNAPDSSVAALPQNDMGPTAPLGALID